MVTSAKVWRKAREEGFELTFPSGHVEAVRPIEVDFFVMHGKVLDPLAGMLNDILDGKTVPVGDIPAEELMEKREKWLPLLNEIASYMLVNPVCRNGAPGDPLGEDEISVWDLSYADKVFLYRFICRPADFLDKFRAFQIHRVASVDAPEGNGRSTEPLAPAPVVGEPDAGNAGPDHGNEL